MSRSARDSRLPVSSVREGLNGPTPKHEWGRWSGGGGTASGIMQVATPFGIVAESVTFPAGYEQPHAMAMVAGQLFVMCESIPCKIIRFNTPLTDLTNQTLLTFASDGFHDAGVSMVYAPSKGRLYVLFAIGTLKVSEVNPTTMAVSDVITDGAKFMGQGSMTTDDASLYIAANGDTRAYKYNLTGFGLQATSTPDTLTGPHCVVIDSGKMYLTTTGIPAEIYRYNAATMAFEESTTAPVGFSVATDDQAILGNFLYLGVESGINCGNILRYQKTALGNAPTSIPSGLTGIGNIGTFAFDGFIYAHQAGQGQIGRYLQIDPNTLAVRFMVFPSGFQSSNETWSDGAGHLWVTFFQNPGKMVRINIS